MDKGILKEDVRHIIEEAEAKLKKWGEKTVQVAKRGEKEIIKMSRIGRLQLDILGINIRKEKFYKELGKKVIKLLLDGEIQHKQLVALIEKFKSMNEEIKSKKKLMDNIAKETATKKLKAQKK